MVLAADVGGRWSEEARMFVSQLAKAKARTAPHVLAGRVRQAYLPPPLVLHPGMRCGKGFCSVPPGEATCSGV